MELNKIYLKTQNEFNLPFVNNINNKIRIGIYAFTVKNGGRARVTSLLINYFNNIKIFHICLFTRKNKEDNEYFIPNNIKRIYVINNLVKEIKINKIEILIYQLSFAHEIKLLNNLSNIKIIFYQHLGIFDWIYGNYSIFKSLYKEYINSKYVVNIIPFENDYLFRKWGIYSILMNNFITYDFNRTIPSDLSSNTILMIGRGSAKKKRFPIGIQALEYIIQDIPKCEMLIISDLDGIIPLKYLSNNINIINNIKFVGYSSTPEIFFKNSSLLLFPSISEAFPLVICETKLYGIPNILLGLDYTTISEGGSIIIYDESPESLAKYTIKALKSYKYRHILGRIAKNKMKVYNNDLLLKKWIKIILSIYNGDINFEKMRKNDDILSVQKSLQILKNQINLLEKRISDFKNSTINDIENFTFMEEKIIFYKLNLYKL